MKQFLLLFLALFGLLSAGHAQEENHAHASLYARADGEDVKVAIEVKIDRGWHLYHGPTKEDLGDAPRKRVFDTDTTLPTGFKRIKSAEYANTGFDRGHVCPHGDRSANEEMSFSTFVMGLTTQALMHLGEITDPVEQRVAHDLPAAKQMIDLLGILRDKTKGNLDAAEEQLLGEVLYDLRMRYVEVARGR